MHDEELESGTVAPIKICRAIKLPILANKPVSFQLGDKQIKKYAFTRQPSSCESVKGTLFTKCFHFFKKKETLLEQT